MPDKDPQNINLFMTCIMIGAALLGGLARWLQKFKDPAKKTAWSVMELLAHVVMALFSGGLAFVVAEHFQFTQNLTVAAISLSSYFGGESVEIVKQIAVGFLRNRAGLPPEPKP